MIPANPFRNCPTSQSTQNMHVVNYVLRTTLHIHWITLISKSAGQLTCSTKNHKHRHNS